MKAHVEQAGGTLRDELFGQRGPASAFSEVASLSHPDYVIELEAIAVI